MTSKSIFFLETRTLIIYKRYLCWDSNKLALNNLHGAFKHNIYYAMIYSYALHIVLLYPKYAAVVGELKNKRT